MRLSTAVGSAILAGVVMAGVAEWILFGAFHPQAGGTSVDVTKLALTLVGGVGGVVALVIAYRRQSDLEQGRFVERFGAAAAQLGASDVAVRLAGVYAMAGVADESDGVRRQQCIDVLCGYLRLPYSPGLGANHQTKRVRKQAADSDGADIEDHFEYRQNDREVRKTITRVITAHLVPLVEYSWSSNDFDFRDAVLVDANFFRAVFSGDTSFRSATFVDSVSFANARFDRYADFESATFSGDANFGSATFSGDANFGSATFSGRAGFDFVTFWRDTRFKSAAFFAADFTLVHIYGVADFESVTFSGETTFKHGTFDGGATFVSATYAGGGDFTEVYFGRVSVLFDGPKQWGPPPPVFDWDSDPSTKPVNVLPEVWPPEPIGAGAE
ncbi:pentapeptide repeat-containing protein [Nocardia sp. NPDC051321]|uniref:pentapeptide repeat-containing protein n=1 Tax=Nocardia sp. NPDC051321 TaxID=3364323 RepID=UPI0037A48B01